MWDYDPNKISGEKSKVAPLVTWDYYAWDRNRLFKVTILQGR